MTSQRLFIIEKKKPAGFTFIELMLVVGLLMIFSVPVVSYGSQMVDRMAVKDATEGFIGLLQEAQSRAFFCEGVGHWGVKFQPGEIVLFQGDSYESRLENGARSFPFNPRLEIEGFDELVFSCPEAKPNVVAGNIILKQGGEQQGLSINPEGIIEAD